MYIEQKLLHISEVLINARQAISFGLSFVWLTGFYILYKLFKHKFLLWLIWAEILGIIEWLYIYRHHFIGMPETQNAPHLDMWISMGEQVYSFIVLIVSVIGAVLGLHYLQKKFREFTDKGKKNQMKTLGEQGRSG